MQITWFLGRFHTSNKQENIWKHTCMDFPAEVSIESTGAPNPASSGGPPTQQTAGDPQPRKQRGTPTQQAAGDPQPSKQRGAPCLFKGHFTKRASVGLPLPWVRMFPHKARRVTTSMVLPAWCFSGTVLWISFCILKLWSRDMRSWWRLRLQRANVKHTKDKIKVYQSAILKKL